MKLPTIRNRAKRGASAGTQSSKKQRAGEASRTPKGQAMWTGGSRAASAAATALLIGAGLCGPVALAVAASNSQQEQQTEAEDSSAVLPQATSAEETAREVVIAWLSTTRDNDAAIKALVPTSASIAAKYPDHVARFANVAIAQTQRVEDDVWLITVGVDVEEPAQEGETPPVWRRFYNVAVHVDTRTGSVQALSLPAPTAGPGRTKDVRPNYTATLTSSDQRVAAVQGFLNAQGAGQGAIERFLAPGAQIYAIAPAPYSEVKVSVIELVEETSANPEEPADGDKVEARVLAQATRHDGQSVPIETYLTLTARSARWEISSQHHTPHLRKSETTPPTSSDPSAQTSPNQTGETQ